MKTSEYIAKRLVELGVTDAFGLPGGVILELIYALDATEGIIPHLCYHEQSAGFAACGYAQISGKLGVAYATRGPGFTNLITAIADAYYDSLPVLFITAHAAPCPPEGMRIMEDQEMDTCVMVNNITKYAARLDNEYFFSEEFEKACQIALEGRKGPVFLDISAALLKSEIDTIFKKPVFTQNEDENLHIGELIDSINNAKRPVILVGDGVNQAKASKDLLKFIENAKIPVVSSRFSHDLCCSSEQYFGYVGSHGIRTANFILSKADLVISLGNRLHFPPQSTSFGDIFKHARLIRVELDKNEFTRQIPNSTNINADVAKLLKKLAINEYSYSDHSDWMEVCAKLEIELHDSDTNRAVYEIANILSKLPKDAIVVNDVGNIEFLVARACILIKLANKVMYSKSFGALGCGLGKAIGTYYATQKPVLCFVGDQGLQINIQELQYISQHNLPIIVVIINNETSGMIKDRENQYSYFLHTTYESGFMSPNYCKISDGYGIDYYEFDELDGSKFDLICDNINKPTIINLMVDPSISLSPNLPRGKKCQDLQPALPIEKYIELNNL